MKKIIAVLLGVAACSTTSILSTWKKPGVSTLKFSKVLVIAPMKDPVKRRNAEDRMVSALAPGVGARSYVTIPVGTNGDMLKQAVKEGGYDGAIVMRVRSVEREAKWVANDYLNLYGGFDDEIGINWYDSGSVQVDTYVRVDTSIYGLPGADLLWSASSRTADPGSVPQLVSDVINTLRNEMKNEGVTPVSARSAPSPEVAAH